MAIYGQPNAWTCGPFALKHALLAHGVFTPAEELARAAGSTEEGGTDERQLQRAARTHRVDVLVVREQTAGDARRNLDTWLKRGIPVLLCVDEWEHWLTAVAADGEHVVVFDSKYDTPLRLEPWLHRQWPARSCPGIAMP
jgi:ABC-type bacteriocin/lantibiotic exporter with double-glycine peptidase domain